MAHDSIQRGRSNMQSKTISKSRDRSTPDRFYDVGAEQLMLETGLHGWRVEQVRRDVRQGPPRRKASWEAPPPDETAASCRK